MSRHGTGLVDLHDDKESNGGFFCVQLVTFLSTEAEPGTERYGDLWANRFNRRVCIPGQMPDLREDHPEPPAAPLPAFIISRI